MPSLIEFSSNGNSHFFSNNGNSHHYSDNAPTGQASEEKLTTTGDGDRPQKTLVDSKISSYDTYRNLHPDWELGFMSGKKKLWFLPEIAGDGENPAHRLIKGLDRYSAEWRQAVPYHPATETTPEVKARKAGLVNKKITHFEPESPAPNPVDWIALTLGRRSGGYLGIKAKGTGIDVVRESLQGKETFSFKLSSGSEFFIFSVPSDYWLQIKNKKQINFANGSITLLWDKNYQRLPLDTQYRLDTPVQPFTPSLIGLEELDITPVYHEGGFLVQVGSPQFKGKTGADMVSFPNYWKEEKHTFLTLGTEVHGKGRSIKCARIDDKMPRLQVHCNHADIWCADFDKGVTKEDVLNHPFVKQYGGLVIESNSSTPENFKCRVVGKFGTPLVGWETIRAVSQYIMEVHLPLSDPAIIQAGSFTFGGEGRSPLFVNEDNFLPQSEIDKAIAYVAEKAKSKKSPKVTQISSARTANSGGKGVTNNVEPSNDLWTKYKARLALEYILEPRKQGSGQYLWLRDIGWGGCDALGTAETRQILLKHCQDAEFVDKIVDSFKPGGKGVGTLFELASKGTLHRRGDKPGWEHPQHTKENHEAAGIPWLPPDEYFKLHPERSKPGFKPTKYSFSKNPLAQPKVKGSGKKSTSPPPPPEAIEPPSLQQQATESLATKLLKSLEITGVGEVREVKTPLFSKEHLKTDKYKIIVTQGSTGSGKSKAHAGLIREKQEQEKPHRFIAVYPAVRLGQSSAEDTGLPFINDNRDLAGQKVMEKIGFTCCFHSFRRGGQLGDLVEPQNLENTSMWLDEPDCIDMSLLNEKNPTLHRKGDAVDSRLNIMQTLTDAARAVIKGGGQIFLSSADVTNIDVDLWVKIAGVSKEDVLYVHNTYVHKDENDPRLAYVAEKPEDLLDKSYTLLEEGKKLIISTNSQQPKSRYGTQTLGRLIKEKFPEKKGLIYDAETAKTLGDLACEFSSAKKITDFLVEHNFDYMITSPIFVSGNSIVVKGLFDARVHFSSGSLVPTQDLQHTDRYRCNVPLYLYAPESGMPSAFKFCRATSPKKIFEQLRQRAKGNLELLRNAGVVPNESSFDVPDTSDHWVKAYCYYTAWANLALTGHKSFIIGRLEVKGYKVLPLASTAPEELVEVVKGTASLGHLDKMEAIAKAKDIDDRTYEKLKLEKALPIGDIRASDKHEIRNRYRVDVTPELANLDSEGWHGAIQNHYLLTVGNCFLAAKDAKAVKDLQPTEGITQRAYVPDIATKPKIAPVKLLQDLGIEKFLDFDKKDWARGEENLEAFAEAARAKYKEIQSILGVKISPDKKRSPITITQSLLKKIGLKLHALQKVGGRGEQKIIYQVKTAFTRGSGDTLKILEPDGLRAKIFDQWLTRDTDIAAKKAAAADNEGSRRKNVSSYDTVVTNGNIYINNTTTTIPDNDYRTKTPPPVQAPAAPLTVVPTPPPVAAPDRPVQPVTTPVPPPVAAPDLNGLVPLQHPKLGQRVAIARDGGTAWGILLSHQAIFARVRFNDETEIVDIHNLLQEAIAPPQLSAVA